MTFLNRFINLSWERGLRDSRSGRLQSAGRRGALAEAGSQGLHGKNFQRGFQGSMNLSPIQVSMGGHSSGESDMDEVPWTLEHEKCYTYPTYPNRNFTLGAHQVMKPTSPAEARWEEVEREEKSPIARAESKPLADASPSMLSVLQEERALSQLFTSIYLVNMLSNAKLIWSLARH